MGLRLNISEFILIYMLFSVATLRYISIVYIVNSCVSIYCRLRFEILVKLLVILPTNIYFFLQKLIYGIAAC